MEEGGFLGDERDVLAVGCDVECVDGGMVDEDVAGLDVVKSELGSVSVVVEAVPLGKGTYDCGKLGKIGGIFTFPTS